MTLVLLQNVSLKLQSEIVLEDVDFEVGLGEVVTLVGPNGAGKTSLLKMIVGSFRPTAGSLYRTSDVRIGYVPQKLALGRAMPVSVARFLKLASGSTGRQVEEAMEFASVEHLGGRQLFQLSGGQLQRVLLAHAMIGEPNLIVLDEPTTGLDQEGILSIYRMVRELRARTGCAVIISSHDLAFVLANTDRVVCLNKRICCEGSPSIVSASPEFRALFGGKTAEARAVYKHHHEHSHEDGGPPIVRERLQDLH